MTHPHTAAHLVDTEVQLNVLNASQVQVHVSMNATCKNVTPHNVVTQLFLMLESASINIIVQR